MKICIIPGSFDPFTLGHRDVVLRAAKLFDKVYVIIMVNAEKKRTFDLETSRKIAELSCEGIENVEVIASEGLLADLCRELKADAIVKGIRNEGDYEYENTLAGINKFLVPEVETVFLPTSPRYAFICSAFVREMIKFDQKLDGVLAPRAVEFIEKNKKGL